MVDTPQTAASQSGLLDYLTKQRRPSGYLFLALSVVVGALAAWCIWKNGKDLWPVSAWGILVLFITAGAGFWQLVRDASGESDPDQTRVFVLTIGGLTGFVTALLGLALPFFQWPSIFAGGPEVWRTELRRLAIVALALFGGLGLSFVSLQFARTKERSSAGSRRLLYGFNAGLSTWLLVVILLLVNSLPYVKAKAFAFLNDTQDWTASRIYTLSEASKGILSSLTEDKPVKLYIIVPQRNFEVFEDIKNLVDNCQAITNRDGKKVLTAVTLLPDVHFAEIMQLQQKYTLPTSSRSGILVIYGDESDKNVQSEFIKEEDLSSGNESVGMPGGGRYVFKGENALMKALTTLTEGKTRAVVYFTQGNGEPELNDFGRDRPGQGLSDLKDRLVRAAYEVKELRFSARTEKMPDDASVVVVVQPTSLLPKTAVDAIRAYMTSGGDKKKGKLIYISGVALDRDKNMVQSGLESLLAEFSVHVGQERLLMFSGNPLQIPALMNRQSLNPIVQAFRSVSAFSLYDARPVRPSPNPNPNAAHYTTEPLIFADPRYPIWPESNLRADPRTLVDYYNKPERTAELEKRIPEEPIPLAVAVSETAGADPHAGMMAPPRGGNQTPRLVVYGSSVWVSNQTISSGNGRYFADLFASNLAWLRERPDVGTIADDKERKQYSISPDPDAQKRLYLLPATLMLICILGMGAGVWVVRRR